MYVFMYQFCLQHDAAYFLVSYSKLYTYIELILYEKKVRDIY